MSSKDTACTGKRRFTSKEKADKEAKKISPMVSAYPCKWCDGWHVGRTFIVDGKRAGGRLAKRRKF